MKKIMYLVGLMVGLAVLPACQRSNNLEAEAMRQDSINAVCRIPSILLMPKKTASCNS